MNNIMIDEVENGWLVSLCDSNRVGVVKDNYVFETPEGLAKFILENAQKSESERDNNDNNSI